MPIGKFHKPLEEFLSSKIEKKHTGCHHWIGYISNGYGTEPSSYWFKFYKVSRAHQLLYIVRKGFYDRTLVIAHLCHNKRCVNPDHLVAVTQEENVKHRYLNPDDVCFIDQDTKERLIDLFTTGLFSLPKLCKMFQISRNRIKAILGDSVRCRPIKKKRASDEGYKLNASQVQEIRALRAKGEKLIVIANMYNIHESTVSKIAKGDRGNYASKAKSVKTPK